MPQIDAPCCSEHVGILAVAIDLAVGEKSPVSAVVEKSPVSAVVAVVSAEVGDDRWGQGVSDRGFENGIFLFQK